MKCGPPYIVCFKHFQLMDIFEEYALTFTVLGSSGKESGITSM